jgi:hypothetical protein
LSIGSKPKVSRSCRSLIEADGAERETEHHRRHGLERRFLAETDEAAESQEIDRENLGRSEAQANCATSGATSVIMMTANSAPTKDEVKAAVSASPARPCCAIG